MNTNPANLTINGLKMAGLEFAYDFYREGIDGKWKLEKSPFKKLRKQHSQYDEMRQALVKHAKDNYPDEVDEVRLGKMMQVTCQVSSSLVKSRTRGARCLSCS